MSNGKRKLSLLEMARVAGECFPGEKAPIRVNHDGDQERYIAAENFFFAETYHFNRALIEQLLDENGFWKYQYQGDLVFDDVSSRELNRVLKDTLDPVYELVNTSLDTTSLQGFNRHDKEHINAVIRNAISVMIPILRRLLREARQNPAKRAEYEHMVKDLIYICRGHDIGNLLSRNLHSVISPDMFESIVPGQLNGNRRTVRRGMMLHNEPVAKLAMESWNAVTYDQQVAYMRKKMSPVGLAAIVGDKFDIGWHRITLLEHTPDENNQDKHLLLNMDFQNRGLEFSKDEKTLTWNLDYLSDLSDEAREQLPHLLREKKKGDQVVLKPWRSEIIENLHKKHNIPYAESSRSLLWKLYWPRIRFAVMAAFALHPDLETFCVTVSDRQADGHAVESSTTSIRRSHLDQDFAMIEKRFALKPKPTPEQSQADSSKPSPNPEIETNEVKRVEVAGPLAMAVR